MFVLEIATYPSTSILPSFLRFGQTHGPPEIVSLVDACGLSRMQVSTGGERDFWLDCLSSGPSFHYVPLSPSSSSGCALIALCTCFWTGTGIVLLEFLLSLSRLWDPPGQTLYRTRLFILRPCDSSCHILGLRKCLWRKGGRKEWTNEKTHFGEIIMSNFIALKLSDRSQQG